MKPYVPFLVLIAILSLGSLFWGGVLKYFSIGGGPNYWIAIFVGAFFGQSSLLGIWGGLTDGRWWSRLLGIAIGLAYLSPLFCFSLDDWTPENHVIIVLSTVLIFVVMQTIWHFFARIEQTNSSEELVKSDGLQFSIRHLMILTFLVSCLVVIGQTVQPFLRGVDQIALILVISLCFVSVGVSSVWAMLGRRRMLLRSTAVFFIGLLAAFALYFLGPGDRLVFWLLLMSTNSFVLLVSLWIVRLCGFRLIRLVRTGQELSATQSAQT